MDGVIEFAPKSKVIIVSNPVDVLTFHAIKKAEKAGFPKGSVMGQAGILDSIRMSSFIAEETGRSIEDINSVVLGGHGDTMVPLPRFTTIGGVSIQEILDKETIININERTRNGGAEVLGLKKTSSASSGPAAAVTQMVESIVFDKKRVLPCITLLNGEYGLGNLAIGVPVVLGKDGIEEIVELDLKLVRDGTTRGFS